jgi:hypothetical protein
MCEAASADSEDTKNSNEAGNLPDKKAKKSSNAGKKRGKKPEEADGFRKNRRMLWKLIAERERAAINKLASNEDYRAVMRSLMYTEVLRLRDPLAKIAREVDVARAAGNIEQLKNLLEIAKVHGPTPPFVQYVLKTRRTRCVFA